MYTCNCVAQEATCERFGASVATGLWDTDNLVAVLSEAAKVHQGGPFTRLQKRMDDRVSSVANLQERCRDSIPKAAEGMVGGAFTYEKGLDCQNTMIYS